MAGPEVVHREPDAETPDRPHLGDGVVHVHEDQALGELELQPGGVGTGTGERVADPFGEIRLPELLRADIDGELQVPGGGGLVPGGQLPAGGLQHPLAVLGKAPVALVVTNRHREVEWANAAYTVLTGWKLEEMKGRNPRSFLHGEKTSSEAIARLAVKLRSGLPIRGIEVLNYRKSGEPYWTSMSIEPFVDASGEIAKYVALVCDITKQKNADQSACAAGRRLQAVCRAAKLAVVHHDVATGAAHCSAELLEWLEMFPSEPELPISDLARRVHLDDRGGLRKRYLQAINSDLRLDTAFRIVSASGTVRHVRALGILGGWDDGYPATFTTVLQDIG